MKRKTGSIIFVLAFALLIQNTCPFGAAGKTAVASSCPDCPFKQCLVVAQPGQACFAAGFPVAHFPLYVFAVPKTVHAFRLAPVETRGAVLAERHTDPLPAALLRPPHA
jgi:hypothetical protein